MAGHSGVHVTMKRILSFCFWKGLEKDIGNFIRGCDICQCCKYDPSTYPRLLRPLPIPMAFWLEGSWDFIEGLHPSKLFEVIMVMVDRLTKYAHFVALRYPMTTKGVAQAFPSNVYKLHGLPSTIVSDRDAIFLSSFGQEFFKLQGAELHLSTAYHPKLTGKQKWLTGHWKHI